MLIKRLVLLFCSYELLHAFCVFPARLPRMVTAALGSPIPPPSSMSSIPSGSMILQAHIPKECDALEECASGQSRSFIPESASIPVLTASSRWELSHFLTPVLYRSYLDYIIIPHGVIRDRIDRMVEEVADAYEGQEITFVCVLKGASIFFHEFMQAFMRLQSRTSMKISFDFVRVKSYNGMLSTGQVQILGFEQHQEAWKDKNIVFVEDIVDTGLTMSRLAEYMQTHVHPASMRYVAVP
jgi:hypoxanthine phosphoribosyltransferase